MASDESLDAAIAEDALFNYAKLQYELGGGAFNGAINVLTRYVERYPSSPRAEEARTLLIAAYYNSRDYDAAYRAIKAMPSGDADIRAALQKIAYFRGLEAYSSGDLKAAQSYLAESAAVNVSPKYSALTSFWQGEIAFAQGDYAVAAAKYNAYLKRAPRTEREYALAWYNLGYCAFDRNDLQQAQEAFGKFLAAWLPRDSYRADALNRLGDAAYSDRRFEAAVGEYDKGHRAGNARKAICSVQTGHHVRHSGPYGPKAAGPAADRRCGRGLCRRSLLRAGTQLHRAGKYAEGAAQLEKFVAAYPASPRCMQAYSDLGLAYLNLGDKQKSLACYDRVVGASPQSAEAKGAMQSIREIYVSEGDVDAYFDYAAKAGVESDLTALSRDSLSFAAAQKLYLGGQRDAAAKSLRSYVASYPKGYYLTDALYYLSDCYLLAGDRENAIGTLTRLAGQGTNQYTVAVLEKLSGMTFEDKRWDEAASAYRRFYDVAPTKTGREDAMTGYVRATVAGGDGAKIAEMAADVCGHDDAGGRGAARSEICLGRAAAGRGPERRGGEALQSELAKEGAHEGGLRSRLLRDRIDVRKRRHGQDRSRRVRLLGAGAAGLLAGAGFHSAGRRLRPQRGHVPGPGDVAECRRRLFARRRRHCGGGEGTNRKIELTMKRVLIAAVFAAVLPQLAAAQVEKTGRGDQGVCPEGGERFEAGRPARYDRHDAPASRKSTIPSRRCRCARRSRRARYARRR